MQWKALYEQSTTKHSKRPMISNQDCFPNKATSNNVNFENNLSSMIRMVEFKSTNDQSQTELKTDIDKIKQWLHIFVFVDKTSNIYKMNTADYQKLPEENIKVA